jgi:toxin ParE1/3/4
LDIQSIIEATRYNGIRITDHADEEAQADHLSFDEIFNTVLHGEIIEDYPSDKPYPNCLVYGDSFAGEPIRSVWAYNHATNGRCWLLCTDLTVTDGLIGASGERDDGVRDLDEIYGYIALYDAPPKAKYVLDQIEGVFSRLSKFRERGAHPKELPALGIREYREIYFKPYRIICRVIEKNVYVLLIVNGRCDMQALLQRRLLGA